MYIVYRLVTHLQNGFSHVTIQCCATDDTWDAPAGKASARWDLPVGCLLVSTEKTQPGWWFGPFFIFPFSWEFHHPN